MDLDHARRWRLNLHKVYTALAITLPAMERMSARVCLAASPMLGLYPAQHAMSMTEADGSAF